MQAIKITIGVLWQTGSASSKTHNFTIWLGEGLRYLLLFPALRIVTPIGVEGIEHIQGDGPYIFAANHSSHLDTPVLLAALPGRLRPRVRVAAAADYFFTSCWKSVPVRILLNAFAFERQGPGCASSLLRARQFLTAGHSLIIFPEGTRTKDGQLQHFKRGVGKLALTEDVPVIPTWIDGTYTALPKGARLPHKQRVTVHFGVPLNFAERSNPLNVAAEIEQHVRALATRTVPS